MSRPPEIGETRTVRIDVRVTAAERDAFDEAAAAAGTDRSTWVRDTLLAACRPTVAPPVARRVRKATSRARDDR